MTDYRRVTLEGAVNFRDIGGIKTSNNKFIKSGILFRSDELSQLTDSDLKTVEKLNLKVIIDFRSLKERSTKIDRVPPDGKIRQVNLPIIQQREDIPKWRFMIWWMFEARESDFSKFLAEHYKEIAFENSNRIREIITLIADKNNLPALIHCAAGKDRTGVITAIIQLLLGLSREQVLNEYLATNDYLGSRFDKMIQKFRRMSLYRLSYENLKPLLEAREEYLNGVLDDLFAKYASIENYLIQHCGVEKNTIEKVKSIFTEN